MKTLFLLCIMCATAIAHGESWPGYRYTIEIVSDQQVDDAPEKSSLYLKIPNAPFDKDEIVVLYETKTRKVIHAVWMTKGGAELLLPKMGVYLAPKPSKSINPVVVLSTDKLKDTESAKVAFLGILWGTDNQKKPNKP